MAAVRTLNRLKLVGETLRAALETLAIVAPAWLQQQVSQDWLARFGQPLDDDRLPKDAAEKMALAQQIGRDGHQLLSKIFHEPALIHLRTVKVVEILRQVWVQQYYIKQGDVCWREKKDRPTATQQILSPYDIEVRGGKKRDQPGLGYRVHLTESCDDDQPHPMFKLILLPVRMTISVRFRREECQCPDRSKCTRAKEGRFISLCLQKEHEAIQRNRACAQTEEFKEKYKVRAGVEGTISQGVPAFGMPRPRYRGLAKTHLQHLTTAAAINVKQAVNWLLGEPLATTRQSHFAALLA